MLTSATSLRFKGNNNVYVSITENIFSGTHKNSRTIEMDSSSFTNAYLVDFDSVLEIPDNEGMQKMFKPLETSGLR
ncbi:hypothetical protein F511_27627 [Dorcoceras hygrometricum]|uniref:Uncharacterized protein n=1 Tax=Dorcoceras hygrometricum TaxID=472368 RepID=A0A2Z7B8Y1_9LAMI|nr:hypothetical protein F511_27627 [Dorcoceras hygrometricum]